MRLHAGWAASASCFHPGGLSYRLSLRLDLSRFPHDTAFNSTGVVKHTPQTWCAPKEEWGNVLANGLYCGFADRGREMFSLTRLEIHGEGYTNWNCIVNPIRCSHLCSRSNQSDCKNNVLRCSQADTFTNLYDIFSSKEPLQASNVRLFSRPIIIDWWEVE